MKTRITETELPVTRPVTALHSGIDAWLKIGLAVGMMLWLGAAGTTVPNSYNGAI